MTKIMIVAGLGVSLVLFRGELIKNWLGKGFKIVAAAPGNEVKGPLEEMGASYRCIPLDRTSLNPFYDVALLFKLKRLLKEEKPDYLFCYTAKPVIFGSLAAYFYRKIRVFVMITGLGYVFSADSWKSLLLQKLVIQLYKIAMFRNEKVFFQNPDDREEFLRLKITRREKMVLINGSGVNTSYFSPVPLPEKQTSFLMIARLLKEKGVKEYIEAAGVVKQKYPEVRFVLVGWSFEENPSAIGQEQVDLWRNEGIVEIYGETNNVRPFIAEASVYVLPSYREGTPRTVLEAMSMGRPIITSDAPGCRETVIDGVNGYLVPVKDVSALVDAMEKFIWKPELLKHMGIESRRLAVKKYDVHKVNQVINNEMGIG